MKVSRAEEQEEKSSQSVATWPIIFLWAVPRSTSTAFELMMRQRGDIQCFHEPFGEVWHCGDDSRCPVRHRFDHRPGLTLETRWAELQEASKDGPIFVKDFPHHAEPIVNSDFLDKIVHSFLIRDPAKALTSLHRQWPDMTVQETGFVEQRQLFDAIAEFTGTAPFVVDSDALLRNPDKIIRQWSSAVGLKFIPEALTWSAGSSIETGWYDGAPWHEALSSSTGFRRREKSTTSMIVPEDIIKVYQEVLPHYKHMKASCTLRSTE